MLPKNRRMVYGNACCCMGHLSYVVWSRAMPGLRPALVYIHSRHMCVWDCLLCCLYVATCCIFVYVYTFVNTQRMSILSPASLRHSIRYIGYTMTVRARSAWSGDLADHDMSPSVVRPTKTPTGQHWQCTRCEAENTGSHPWWRDQNHDTDEHQVWLCDKCQYDLYGWFTFTGGETPLMDYLLKERAAKTRLAKQGAPGGSTCSTHTLLVGTTPSSHVATTQTIDMDVNMGVE
jgi:hypothetical protein